MAEATFLILLDVHAELNELFLQHQEALLAGDLVAARGRLLEFQRRLLGHMQAEEEVLLPVYARAGAIPGGSPAIFTGEHRRMREFAVRCVGMLDWLEAHPADRVRGVLRSFDEHATFKHLLTHHDQREANILYPALDRVTTVTERAALLADVTSKT